MALYVRKDNDEIKQVTSIYKGTETGYAYRYLVLQFPDAFLRYRRLQRRRQGAEELPHPRHVCRTFPAAYCRSYR